jgi:hypothetical protein
MRRGSRAAALAGCGGSTSGPTAHFKARANAICAHGNAGVAKLPAETNVHSIYSDEKAMISLGVAEFDQLKQLTPPRNERAKFEQASGVFDRVLPMLRKIVAAIGKGELKQAERLSRPLVPINAQANRDFDALGLTQCSKVVTPHGSAG